MRVRDLLTLDSLDLTLVWGEPALLAREIDGLTATDLADPRRFLEPGELVLSGLVWWTPRGGQASADRFVAALREAGAVALLAGEERHGGVPDEVGRACRRQGLALLAVPKQTTFRAITDAVYLRRWRELAGNSLPGGLRQALEKQITDGAAADEVLDRISAHLGGLPCTLVTASGRLVARSADAPPPMTGTPRQLVDPAGSPYDTWYLHIPDLPPRVAHELSEILTPYRQRAVNEAAARQKSVSLMLAGLRSSAPDQQSLQACGLADHGSYTYTVVAMPASFHSALHEALLALNGNSPVAVGTSGGEAVAVLPGDTADLAGRLRPILERLRACDPRKPLHAGVSAPVTGPGLLGDGLAQARQALAVAVELGRTVTATEEIASLPDLLMGLPVPVRAAYRNRVLGPLLGKDSVHTALRKTLRAFLACDGSWTRTADTLHLHVNTVHYRIRRVEELTGRHLSRLDDRIDLHTALLATPQADD